MRKDSEILLDQRLIDLIVMQYQFDLTSLFCLVSVF